LDKLKSAGVPVVSIVGNHDRARYVDHISWLDYLSERDYLALLSPTYSAGEVHFKPWDGVSGGYIDLGPVRIFGLPYLGASTEAALRALPHTLGGLPAEEVQYTIMLGHFGLEGEMPVMAGGISQSVVDPLAEHVDYLALGHLHKAFERSEWIYNPGSLETTAMDQRLWPGGYYHVQLELDTQPKHIANHIQNERRSFLRWPFDVELYRDPSGLNQGLRAFLQEQAAKTKAEQPVVEVSLEGVLGFDRTSLDLANVQDIVSQIFDALIVRVKNHTRPTAFELPVGEHLSRSELEYQVLLDLVHQDARYSPEAEGWTRLIQQVKTLALSDQEPRQIVELVKREIIDREGD
ncbi:MAG: hypothetical protein PVF85_05645, partial [Anaerolineales bacterium]